VKNYTLDDEYGNRLIVEKHGDSTTDAARYAFSTQDVHGWTDVFLYRNDVKGLIEHLQELVFE
jgi:hypothetical protein